MNIKLRLTLLNFSNFCLGCMVNYHSQLLVWYKTMGRYQVWSCFQYYGICLYFMPTLSGIIADRWINAERLYGILQILYAAVLFFCSGSGSGNFLLGNAYSNVLLYANDCSEQFYILYRFKNERKDVVKDFPPIRVWGTIGFIAAMWITNLTGSKSNEYQFYIAGASALLLGLYAFSLPKCPPKSFWIRTQIYSKH